MINLMMNVVKIEYLKLFNAYWEIFMLNISNNLNK